MRYSIEPSDQIYVKVYQICDKNIAKTQSGKCS